MLFRWFIYGDEGNGVAGEFWQSSVPFFDGPELDDIFVDNFSQYFLSGGFCFGFYCDGLSFCEGGEFN